MIGRDRFVLAFPEFSELDARVLDQALRDAEATIDPTVYGATEDRAHGLAAACILARSPSGQAARLQSKEGVPTYQVELDQLTQTRAALIRIFP